MVDFKEFRIANNLTTQKQCAEFFGVSQAFISQIEKGQRPIPDSFISKIKASGMTTKSEEIDQIPLLPISAQGGTLNEFVVSIKDSDCEQIISPIKGADFAISVSGSSMEPEYPSGAKILIKKINEKSFIEWGRCYVLDTCNGIVVKKLAAPIDEDPKYGRDYVTCVSVNPDPIYAPFNVPTKDIFGIYRVLMQLVEK